MYSIFINQGGFQDYYRACQAILGSLCFTNFRIYPQCPIRMPNLPQPHSLHPVTVVRRMLFSQNGCPWVKDPCRHLYNVGLN